MEESMYIQLSNILEIAEKMLYIEDPDACFLHCQEAGRLIAQFRIENKQESLFHLDAKLAVIKRKLNSMIVEKFRNNRCKADNKQIIQTKQS